MGHDGALLTDSLIVASYDPKNHQVTMISLPRDLITINDTNGELSKINAILSYNYNNNGSDFEAAVQPLLTKIEKITGLTIPYYMMIDFDGFINVVDSVGGLDIYVPEHFIDREYPIDRNGEVEIFELPAGDNHLSGPNTLKYARSRHSTSDFSRSERQQQIIKALLKKFFGGDSMSIAGIQKIFDSYETVVKTNISNQQFIGLAKYGLKIPDISMFGLTSQCIKDAWRVMPSGCFLRNANG